MYEAFQKDIQNIDTTKEKKTERLINISMRRRLIEINSKRVKVKNEQ
jgi:hypothetical protein